MHRLALVLLLTLVAGCRATPAGVTYYVDVRTPEEYAAGHIRGAVNIPHTEMQTRLRELEPHAAERIIVYCRSGRRSALALQILKAHGFVHAEDGGAMQHLLAEGVPLE